MIRRITRPPKNHWCRKPGWYIRWKYNLDVDTIIKCKHGSYYKLVYSGYGFDWEHVEGMSKFSL